MSDEVWVECEMCNGQEGYVDENDEWHNCKECGGEGGYATTACG